MINNSALTRKIMRELGIDNKDAVLVACRRYSVAGHECEEEKIRAVVAKSKIQINNKTAIIIVKNSWHIFAKLEKVTKKMTEKRKILRVIQSSAIITIILEEAMLDEITDIIGDENILKTQTDLVEISVTSPEIIEETSGVIAHMASALSNNGINVVETMSCYTDTIFVVDEKDMTSAFEILNSVIKK
jgi:hypothetical protein